MNHLDLPDGSAIPFTEVPNLIPKRRGKKVHYSTVYRWATKGTRGRVLESRLIGGVRYTTVAALNRFFGATTIRANNDPQASAIKRALYGDA